MSVSKLFGALCAVTIMAAPGFAQDYPARTMTMVIPFSAGGPTDTVARLLAERMSADLGQQIIVENVTGAGGTLGADRVAKTTDVVKEGDKVWVKLMGFDERGKVRLSMKVVDQASGQEIRKDAEDAA